MAKQAHAYQPKVRAKYRGTPSPGAWALLRALFTRPKPSPRHATPRIRLRAFFDGAGSILDLGGTAYDRPSAFSPDEADYLAILSDWQAVGRDLRAAESRFRTTVSR